MHWFYVTLLVLVTFSSMPQCTYGAATKKNCSEPRTVEGCSIIRLMWSFDMDTNKCERHFVCSSHANAFQSEMECKNTCRAVPTRKPKPPLRDCSYWLLHLGQCAWSTLKQYFDQQGTLHKVLWFTGCKGSKNKLYSYSLYSGNCKEHAFCNTYNNLL
uniref:Putative bpti/kunitz family of serine protease inhibitor n=1 Tax=Amblyomma tuberculatum TaxID=48802 RepID=A0A6M2E4F1_9ACAR